MVYEEDYILRMTKIMGLGISQLFNKEMFEQLELKEEQNLFNKGAPFAQLYTDLMNKQKYDLLVRLIQSIKFKLPLYEYEELIDFFMMDLKNKSTLNELQVEDYVKQLKAEDDFNFFV